MTKSLSNISLEKTKKNAETILKTYELFIYGDTHVHFVKKCDKKWGILALKPTRCTNFSNLFLE
jgi:hypothetical protein